MSTGPQTTIFKGALPTRRDVLVGAGTVLLGGVVPAQAHHSFAVFDRSVQVTLVGTVREFQWTNPHIFIQLMVRNDKGVEEEWSIEGASPNMLFRRGWTPQSFRPGDKVTLTVNPLRDGGRGGNFVHALFPDGKTLGDMAATVPG
jgi:hypothetical protein